LRISKNVPLEFHRRGKFFQLQFVGDGTKNIQKINCQQKTEQSHISSNLITDQMIRCFRLPAFWPANIRYSQLTSPTFPQTPWEEKADQDKIRFEQELGTS